MTRTYSTAEVAAELEVPKTTLFRWLSSGTVPEPKMETFGGVSARVWTEADVRRARKHKEEHYRKRS